MINYLEKYIKYKLKYDNIKNNNCINEIDLICTHNRRLRSFISSISKINEIIDNVEKIKFKNCCILKIKIFNNTLKIYLLYEGELNDYKIKGQYFVTEYKNKDDVVFPKIRVPLEENIQKLVNKNKKYKFLLIRHAQIENTKSLTNTDPTLSIYGIEQAIKIGNLLSYYNINNVFCSPSKRTITTIQIILSQFKMNISHIIYILSCSKELPELHSEPENIFLDNNEYSVKCAQINYLSRKNIELCNNFKINDNLFIIEWKYWIYNKMNKDELQKCNESNMLIEALKIKNNI
jgi:broad specificity phosphatase PhoE